MATGVDPKTWFPIVYPTIYPPPPQNENFEYGYLQNDFQSRESNEPVHEISNNVVCVTSKASDQPAHMRSLIRAFASRLSNLKLLSYWLNTIFSL